MLYSQDDCGPLLGLWVGGTNEIGDSVTQKVDRNATRALNIVRADHICILAISALTLKSSHSRPVEFGPVTRDSIEIVAMGCGPHFPSTDPTAGDDWTDMMTCNYYVCAVKVSRAHAYMLELAKPKEERMK